MAPGGKGASGADAEDALKSLRRWMAGNPDCGAAMVAYAGRARRRRVNKGGDEAELFGAV